MAWMPWTTGAEACVRRAATASMCIGFQSPDSRAKASWSDIAKRRVVVVNGWSIAGTLKPCPPYHG